MKRLFYSLFFLATLTCIHTRLQAQENACGADFLHQKLLREDPAYREILEQNELKMRSLLDRGGLPQTASLGSDGIYYIPVVVHIIHTGEAIGSSRNPTDAKVQAAINYTNRVFEAGSGFTSSVPFPVKFVLAKRAPDCTPTNGIVRVDGSSVPGFSPNGGVSTSGASGFAKELDIKNLSRWPNTDYYNIWVVPTIQSYEGFAYYPGAPASIDGTMMRVSSINSLNTTLAHELGHGFNLRHTFEGDANGSACPDTSRDCATSGDLVCDTEPHRRPSGCPSDPNPCTGQSYYNTQYNVMNYSSCKNRFTPGQRSRFIAALGIRSSLAQSMAWLPPGDLPAAACTPELSDPSTFTGAGIIRVTLNRLDYPSTYATTEGGLLDKTCTQGDTLFRQVSYTLTVRTQSRAQNVRAYIDYNNDGTFGPVERIFSSNGNTVAFQQQHTGSFTVPAGALTGVPLRLRVISDVSENADPQPCGPYLHGQAEDYTIVLAEPPALAGIIAGASDTICYEGTPAAAGFSIPPSGTGAAYQWYYKEGVAIAPTGSATTGWIPVPEATGSSYTPPAGLTASRSYACMVSPEGEDPLWAAGVHYTIVLPAPTTGGITGSWTILTGTSPGPMSLFPQAAGDRAFAYQWYSKTGIAAAPSGASTAGWTLIPAGNTMPFDPGPITQHMTFACFVTPLGSPSCGTAGWATGARQITVVSSWFDTGELARGDTTICSGGDPDSIFLARVPHMGDGGTSPGSGNRNYQYRWCYRPGIHDAPVGPYSPAWIVIAGNNAPFYDPGPQTESVTFACFLSFGGIMQEGGWVEGCRQITVLPPFSPGRLTNADETVCYGKEPATITLEELPTGAELYSYQWHYREGTVEDCPAGEDTGGWIPVGEDTENSLDPEALTADRTYAVFITPGGLLNCGTPQWAEGCRKLSVLPEILYGTLNPGDQTFTGSGDPGPVSFSVAPAGPGTFSYQWYAKEGIEEAPSGSDTGGWASIEGANTATYDPPVINQSTTYACFVMPEGDPACETGQWAEGARQITIIPYTFDPGAIVSGNQTLCNGEQPDSIFFATVPSGNTSFTYQWYYREGIVEAPSGDDATGWTLIGDAEQEGYRPASPEQNRTYACFLVPEGLSPVWAGGARQLTLLPDVSLGSLQSGDQLFAQSGDPDPVEFETLPSGAGSFSYQWYAADTLVASPDTITMDEWDLLEGATASSYDPPVITQSTTYACWVSPSDPSCGEAGWAGGTRQITIDITIGLKVTEETGLLGNQPNPFGSETRITCTVPAGSRSAEVWVHTIDGKQLRHISLSGNGPHEVLFRTNEMEPGIYIYSLVVDGTVRGTKKMVLLGE